MKKHKKRKPISAEAIARQADQGKDISKHFTNKMQVVHGVQRVNVDFTLPMLKELDEASNELNISRQALIKTFVRHALDQHHLARIQAQTSRTQSKG